jgi:hypothetical protein
LVPRNFSARFSRDTESGAVISRQPIPFSSRHVPHTHSLLSQIQLRTILDPLWKCCQFFQQAGNLRGFRSNIPRTALAVILVFASTLTCVRVRLLRAAQSTTSFDESRAKEGTSTSDINPAWDRNVRSAPPLLDSKPPYPRKLSTGLPENSHCSRAF